MMAWELTLENAISALCAPVVLLSLQRMSGYQPAYTSAASMAAPLRENNANALAFVIFAAVSVANLSCVAGYTALHWTICHDLGDKEGNRNCSLRQSHEKTPLFVA